MFWNDGRTGTKSHCRQPCAVPEKMGMTQLDLSERINYSDKSISKWERGDGIPDVPTLMQLAEIFGVSVNALLCPPDLLPKEPVEPKNDAISGNSTESRFSWKHIFITLLSVAGVWLAAILMICLFQYLAPGIAGTWDRRILCYALTGSFIVFLIFSSLWWPRAWIFLSISGMIWAGALSVFVTFYTIHGAAIVFALAGILELPVLVCYFWRCAAEHRWLIPYPIPRQEKISSSSNERKQCVCRKNALLFCILPTVERFLMEIGGFYAKIRV